MPPPKLPIRWGAPEQERLEAMLRQASLFYWKGPQTALLTERFREVCPVKYVHTCSSGTAALHIAVAAAGVGIGDEVITSPITDMGTPNAWPKQWSGPSARCAPPRARAWPSPAAGSSYRLAP
jgi:dTDP-4-amino-4,6-dideoxygalactose transaminase